MASGQGSITSCSELRLRGRIRVDRWHNSIRHQRLEAPRSVANRQGLRDCSEIGSNRARGCLLKKLTDMTDRELPGGRLLGVKPVRGQCSHLETLDTRC